MRFILSVNLVTLIAFVIANAKMRADEDFEDGTRKPRYTLSPNTTFFAVPLRKNGSVDYAAAINARLSKGVTPQKNACGLLFQVFGPVPEKRPIPNSFFEALQIPRPPDEGTYFQFSPTFVVDQDDRLAAFYKNLETAMSRPWKRLEFPGVSDWLDQNEEPSRKITTAAKLERCTGIGILSTSQKS